MERRAFKNHYFLLRHGENKPSAEPRSLRHLKVAEVRRVNVVE
jgi:hypothetical protein